MSETLTQTLARNPLAGSAMAQGDALRLLDVSASGIAKDAAATLLELVKALCTRGEQANSSGNTTITLGVLAMQHTEHITFTGAGSTTRIVVLATSLAGAVAPVPGARLRVRGLLPATADITVEFRTGTSGGTRLHYLITDGSGDDFIADFDYDATGATWVFAGFIQPANAYP